MGCVFPLSGTHICVPYNSPLERVPCLVPKVHLGNRNIVVKAPALTHCCRGQACLSPTLPKQGLRGRNVSKHGRLCRNVAVRFIAHYIYCRMNPTATTYCGDIIKNMGYDTTSGAWERDIVLIVFFSHLT